MRNMVCVHYIIKKNGKTIIENFGYYESKESAKKTLTREWKNFEIIIK